MVRVDGQNPVSAGPAGPERRGSTAARRPDARLRTCILLGNMPSRRDAGHRFMVRRTTQEEPFLLLARYLMAALRRVGTVRHSPGGGRRIGSRPAGSLQLLRPHSAEPAGSRMAGGQQRARVPGRKGRQLCVLFHRDMDQESGDIRHSRRDIRRAGRSGLAQRTHLL